MTKAAGRLRIAQPALSRQIASLEADLGVPVFVRIPRGVELTAAGEILLEHAYATFSLLSKAYRDVTTQSSSPMGIVVVGTPPTAGEFILPPLLSLVHHDYPEIELRFVEGFSRELEKALLSGEIALAVMHDPPDRSDVHSRELVRDSLHLIGPAGALESSSYALRDAARYPLILPPRPNFMRVFLDSVADAEGVELNVVQRVDGVWHLKALLRGGHGFSLLTLGAVLTEVGQGSLDARPIATPEIHWPLCVAARVDQRRKMAVAVVEEAIHAVVRDLSERNAWK